LSTGFANNLQLRPPASRLTAHDGTTHHADEIAMQEWHGDHVFRERFFYDPGNQG
jgi:hypothetical protein